MKLKPRDMIKRSIIAMMRDDPFFATIILKHNIVETTETNTMSIDGVTLRYNPEFVQEQTDAGLAIISSHEAHHIAMGHHIRMPEHCDFDLWNQACDLAINHFLCDRKGFPTDSGIVAGRGEYKDLPSGKNAEWYYSKLTEKKRQEENKQKQQEQEDAQKDEGEDDQKGNERKKDGSKGNDQRDGGPDEQSDGGGEAGKDQATDSDDADSSEDEGNGEEGTGTGNAKPTETEKAGSGHGSSNRMDSLGDVLKAPESKPDDTMSAETKWEMMISQAMMDAKDAGKMPAYMAEAIKTLLGVAQINWKAALRPFLLRTVKSGSTYSTPNRRSMHRTDIILPARLQRGLEHIFLGVDTSGSMQKSDMDKALVELQAIGKTFKNFRLTVCQCDTQINYEQEFSRTDSIEINKWDWKGRGGTRFKPMFDRAAELKPKCIIILTDGYACDGFPQVKGIPTMWLMTTDVKAPNGRTIRMR